jgi:hypothetical protein
MINPLPREHLLAGRSAAAYPCHVTLRRRNPWQRAQTLLRKPREVTEMADSLRYKDQIGFVGSGA